jgi:hypothetical protein
MTLLFPICQDINCLLTCSKIGIMAHCQAREKKTAIYYKGYVEGRNDIAFSLGHRHMYMLCHLF